MDEKKTAEELLAQLCLEPGFVLIPQDRYEELVRAETERDVLEATITGENKYNVSTVMDAIFRARGIQVLPRTKEEAPEGKGDAQ